ncbi:hypothetical protein [Hydrogenimonas sp.]
MKSETPEIRKRSCRLTVIDISDRRDFGFKHSSLSLGGNIAEGVEKRVKEHM